MSVENYKDFPKANDNYVEQSFGKDQGSLPIPPGKKLAVGAVLLS